MEVNESGGAGGTTMKPEAIAGGVILVIVGGAMLLQTGGWLDVPAGRLIAPLMLIAMGALSLVDEGRIGFVAGYRGGREARRRLRHSHRRVSGGIWLMGIGVWMLISQLHLFGLDFHTSWPLLLILSGLLMLIRGVR